MTTTPNDKGTRQEHTVEGLIPSVVAQTLLERLRIRAAIRRKLRFARDQVGKDRISDLLDEAADEIERLCELRQEI